METRICLGCMREIDNAHLRCPYCGFSLNDPHSARALALKTILNDRYVIGKPLKIDGEGISYIAFDAEQNTPAVIREYMPQQMVRRLPDGDLQLLNEYLPQYKALLSDFEELYHHIMSWNSMSHIRKVYDLFRANHTVYAVSVYEKGMTLQDFLERRGGKLSWNEARKLFDPMLAELEMIHNSGFIHRGISPDSLLVTEDGLTLIAFSISSAKVAGSEIEPSIPKGYAAPEQYSVSPHGSWTDIYSICAVLYRVLTGERPQSPMERSGNENDLVIHQKNPSVPENISAALMHGMSLYAEERPQSIHELRLALDGITNNEVRRTTKEHEAIHPYYKSEHLEEIKEDEEDIDEEDLPDDEKPHGHPLWVKVLVASVPVIIIVCILLYQLMVGFSFLPSVSKLKTESETQSEEISEAESVVSEAESIEEEEEDEEVSRPTAADDQVQVPNLLGMNYDSLSSSSYQLSFSTEYVYSEDYSEGQICSQSVSAGTKVSKGSKIGLYVSKGSQYVTLPASRDYTASQYANLLKNKYEVPYTINQEYSDVIASTYIISVEPSAGSTYDRSSGQSVVITESLGPDPSLQTTEESDDTVG